jgi:hypothetical protein
MVLDEVWPSTKSITRSPTQVNPSPVSSSQVKAKFQDPSEVDADTFYIFWWAYILTLATS